jgi:hypothetical protein
MAAASYTRTSFLGGEWSQAAQGAMDSKEYIIAMNVCFNGFPMETGAWQRRPGTRFASTTRGNKPGRVIPFAFNNHAAYSIELTDEFIRFYVGGALALSNDGCSIASISYTTPAVVETTSAHGWSTDMSIRFGDLRTTLPLLQNRTFHITVIDPTHFAIADAITFDNIDGNTLGVAAPGAFVGRVQEVSTVYTGGSWSQIRAVQTEDTAVLLHPAVPPRSLEVVTPPHNSYAIFAIAPSSLQDGPYLDPVPGITVIPSARTGAITLTASAGIFKSTDVGRLVRLFSQPPFWLSTTSYTKGDYVLCNGTVYQALFTDGAPAGAIGNAFSTNAANVALGQPGTNLMWGPAPAGQLWTWGTITGYSSPNSANIQLNGPNLLYDNAISTWRLGVYNSADGYPSCGTYHEGRLWLSGTVGNRIDGSKSNDPFNFAPTETTGAVSPNNGISYVFNASDVNSVLWMESDDKGIICGTQAGEWLVQATSLNAPLTPTSIQAHRVTRIGCANVQPARTDHTLIFVQRYSRKLMEYFPDVYSGKYSAPNLTERAKHLTVSGIAALAYQQELTPIIWSMTNFGEWRGATYKRETLTTSQGPSFVGWHSHQLGSHAVLTSMCVGPSIGGATDSLMMTTFDASDDSRHVLLLGDIPDETTQLSSMVFLDHAVAPSSYTLSPTGATLNGLWHLNGRSVSVYCGGLNCDDPGEDNDFVTFLVTNGSCFVPFGDGVSAGSGQGLFTADFINESSPAIYVGFSYTSRGQIVRPASMPDTGARNGPGFGKLRRTHRYSMLLSNTKGLSVGTSFANMLPAQLRQSDGFTPIGTLEMFSGIHQDSLEDGDSYDSMICWEVSGPYPATLCAVGANLETKDQ